MNLKHHSIPESSMTIKDSLFLLLTFKAPQGPAFKGKSVFNVS